MQTGQWIGTEWGIQTDLCNLDLVRRLEKDLLDV
jgi:hypothetical protein